MRSGDKKSGMYLVQEKTWWLQLVVDMFFCRGLSCFVCLRCCAQQPEPDRSVADGVRLSGRWRNRRELQRDHDGQRESAELQVDEKYEVKNKLVDETAGS